MANAPTKRVKDKSRGFTMPPLTSLMDAITILTFFLLTQMSQTAIINPLVEGLPYSDSQEEAVKGITFSMDKNGLVQDLGPDKGDKRKVLIATSSELAGDAVELSNMRAVLDQEKARSEMRRIPIQTVTVEIDSMIPYNWVLKLINTAGVAEYPKIDFVVLKRK